MITNAGLTIFNCFPDKQARGMIYVPHYVEHIWFYKNQKTSVADGGLSSADEYKIRIPYSECSNWTPPEDFKNLPDISEKWTVQNGDLFIVGKWAGVDRINGIEEIRKEFSGVAGKVLSHSENFFGSSPHIRIGGGS